MKNYSVNEIADCVKVSAPTVRSRIKYLGIEEVAKSGKALLYSEADSIKICSSFEISEEVFRAFFESTEADEENEKKRKTKEKEKKKENEECSDYAGLGGAELVDFLFKELERKEKEIEKKEKEIEKKEKESDFFKEQIQKKDEQIASLSVFMAKQMGMSLEDFRARAEAGSIEVNTTEKKEGFFKKFFKGRKD